MYWDSYTTFTLLGGITLLVLAVLAPPGVALRWRGRIAVAGVLLTGFAFYDAHDLGQRVAEGRPTVEFIAPIMYATPFVAAGALLVLWIVRVKDGDAAFAPAGASSRPGAASPAIAAPAAADSTSVSRLQFIAFYAGIPVLGVGLAAIILLVLSG